MKRIVREIVSQDGAPLTYGGGLEQITFEQAICDVKTKPIAWLLYGKELNWITSVMEKDRFFRCPQYWTARLTDNDTHWPHEVVERFCLQSFSVQAESKEHLHEIVIPTLIRMAREGVK